MFQLAPQGVPGAVRLDLPPTLLPRAIATAAPPRDRARSLLMAGAVYLALAGSGILLSHAKAVLPAPPIRTGPPPTLIEWNLRPPVPEPVRPAPPAGPVQVTGALSNPGPVRVLPQDIDPTVIPTGLPHQDLSGLQMPRSTGPVPIERGPGSTTEPPGSAQIRFIDTNAVRILRQVNPIYPALARMTHIQGPVVLMMTIDQAGVPTDVQVLEGHPVFREEAIRAARQWRFEPARVEGRPVPASFRLTLNFRLR